MDKIRALKEKHEMPSMEDLIELISARIPRMQHNLKEKEQQLSEFNTKIQELKSKISTLEESVNAEEQLLSVKGQQYILSRDNLKELEADRNNLITEVRQLELQTTKLKNKKPSSRDEETLKNGQKKLNLYRQFTGIKWDYGAPSRTVKGYVTNGKNHIHTFNYEKKEDEKYSSKLEAELWKDVAKGTERLNCPESNGKEHNAPDN